MQVQVTSNPERSQAELDISISIDEFRPFIERAARTLSKKHPLKGFRPGKAGVDVVVEHIGHERLLKEAMDVALPHFFVEAAAQHTIEAINQPSVTVKELGLDVPLHFLAIVDVLPQITLGDPTSIRAKKREMVVHDEQVDHELEHLAKMRSQYLEVARPAEVGDVVNVDFQIRVDGQPIEGGESKNHPVTLGDGHFVPDFEKGITGIKAGEQRQFTMKFPDDYPKKGLQGKQAQARVTAQSIQKRVIPDMTDAFAKQLGSFESLEHLKAELKKNMTKELKKKEEDRYFGELAEKYAEQSTVPHIPDVLIEREIDNRLQEFVHMLAHQQKTLDDYLTKENKTLQNMRDEMRVAAEKNITVGLTLRRFAEQHNISVSKEEIEAEAIQYLRQFKDPQEAEKAFEPDELRDQIESVLRNRRTLQKLAELVEKKE